MNLFIDDISVKIYKTDRWPLKKHYDHIVNTPISGYIDKKFTQRVWVKKAFPKDIEIILDFIASDRSSKTRSFEITTPCYREIKNFITSRFKIINAAGGIVSKNGKILLIERFKKWDLPKGKKEKNENYRETAKREIKEECNVIAIPEGKICTTWHTYSIGKKNILKKTKWYSMHLINDTKMRPCLSEKIEQIKWMNPEVASQALRESYRSIQMVFDQYLQKK